MAEQSMSTEAVAVEDLAEQFDAADWIPDALAPYWEMLRDYPVLGALTMIVAFYVLAHLTRIVFVMVSKRLANKSHWVLGNVFVERLQRPVFITTFLLGVMLSVRAAQLSFGAGFLINVAASIIVVNWTLALLRLSAAVLAHLSSHPRAALVEPRTIPLFDVVIKLSLILVVSYALLLVWGINPVGWLASAGIIGIAIGFAAKDTLANLFSGLFILADSPYEIGDYVNLDSGERGEIIAIGMRSTRILTRADVEITVPNAVMANAKITNESGGPHQKMRVQLPVGAAYGSDVDRVCELLRRLGEAHPDTCADPEPRVRMRGFGPSSLDFELLCWIEEPKDRGRVAHELFMAIYKAFAAAGIEIPYSKHDVYIKEYPASGE